MTSTPKKALHVDASFDTDMDISSNSLGVASPSSAVSDELMAETANHRYLRFVNCSLFIEGSITRGELVVDTDEGVIVEAPDYDVDTAVIDLDGLIISPGYLDVQINGAFGFDFTDDKYQDGSDTAFRQGLKYLAKQMVRTGVTSYCPTLPSTYQHVYKKVLPNLRPERISYGAENIGVHLEGPFLSPKKPGCHPQDAMRTAPKHIESFKEMYGEDNLAAAKIITVAAEQEGVMESIGDLSSMGLVVSLGHSVLNYSGGCEAVKQGASMVTHIYNAMTQPHHRESGLFGLLGATPKDLTEQAKDCSSIKNHSRPSFGVIADGIHVHPSCVSIAYHANVEGCCLVTDAMFPMGLPSGSYPWGAQTIIKEDRHLFLDGTDTIAGSALQLDDAVRNLMSWTGISLADALKTVTEVPAKTVGVYGKKGVLRAGADADLTVLDSNGFVRSVYKLGQKVFQADSSKN